MDFIEAVFKLIIVLAILLGLDLFMAQLLAFLLSTYGVNSGIWQDLFAVMFIGAVTAGGAKAGSKK